MERGALGFVTLSLVAMGVYGVFAILLRSALKSIPVEPVLIATNLTLVIVATVWALVRGVSLTGGFGWDRPTLYVALGGLLLSVSIISLYTAMSRGPVSTVLPIFAMNFAVAAVLGFIVLHEPLSATRIAGVALGTVAVVLLTR
jgi:uncharacterized membrane protein